MKWILAAFACSVASVAGSSLKSELSLKLEATGCSMTVGEFNSKATGTMKCSTGMICGVPSGETCKCQDPGAVCSEAIVQTAAFRVRDVSAATGSKRKRRGLKHANKLTSTHPCG